VKHQRIVYIQKQQGKTIMGIGQTAARYLVEGMKLPEDRGGGKIGSMELIGDLVYIRKVDDAGKPVRNFGKTAMPGNIQKQLIADGVAFPVTLCEGILFVEEADTVSEQDPPVAKPVQMQQQKR
jgi:hypothetical protein